MSPWRKDLDQSCRSHVWGDLLLEKTSLPLTVLRKCDFLFPPKAGRVFTLCSSCPNPWDLLQAAERLTGGFSACLVQVCPVSLGLLAVPFLGSKWLQAAPSQGWEKSGPVNCSLQALCVWGVLCSLHPCWESTSAALQHSGLLTSPGSCSICKCINKTLQQ